MKFFNFRRKKRDKVKQKVALRNYTLGGRISTLLAAISVVLLIWAIALSYTKEGHGGQTVGVVAFVSMCTCIIGFIFGIRSFYEKGAKFLKFTWIGTITSMVLLVFYAGMILAYI